MKIAVMQPYFFPYIGYFQLVNAVDKFIFYDDVRYIKNGWINRNRILIRNEPKYLTLNIHWSRTGTPINEKIISDNRLKLIRKLELAYKKAPYFKESWPVVLTIINHDTEKICDFAINSVKLISSFLHLSTEFETSSEHYGFTKNLGREERLIAICRINHADTYLNSCGGMALYSRDKFSLNGIRLDFIRSKQVEYRQFIEKFVPGLSIIDVIMFNGPDKVRSMLDDYELL